MRQGYHTDGGLSERQPGLGTVKRDGHHKRDAVGELLTNYTSTAHQHGGREDRRPTSHASDSGSFRPWNR